MIHPGPWDGLAWRASLISASTAALPRQGTSSEALAPLPLPSWLPTAQHQLVHREQLVPDLWSAGSGVQLPDGWEGLPGSETI